MDRERKLKMVACCYLLKKLRAKKEKRERKFWVRPIFTEEQRNNFGASNLVEEMRLGDTEKYKNFLRMTPEMFDNLLNIVGPKIVRLNYGRASISPSTRLALTLRYLATGDSMISMSYLFRIGASTVSGIISETCFVLWETLNKVMLMEETEENWKQVAKGFSNQWNFPSCIGAIDGKHVVTQAPAISGSTYYNYKGSFSINLMAICDANYCFISIDIGAPGRQSDGGVFRKSNMGLNFENNLANIPAPIILEENGPLINYTLVADEAFPLTSYMMRPYARRSILNRRKKVFNYRLSRARRTIENTFGILAARWRIFRKPIISSLETLNRIVLATVCLHNYIMKIEHALPMHERTYCPANFPDGDDRDGQWRSCGPSYALQNAGRLGSNTFTQNAAQLREHLSDYFQGPGAVDWQWERADTNNF